MTLRGNLSDCQRFGLGWTVIQLFELFMVGASRHAARTLLPLKMQHTHSHNFQILFFNNGQVRDVKLKSTLLIDLLLKNGLFIKSLLICCPKHTLITANLYFRHKTNLNLK